jgi:hypothetical protein
MSVVVLQVRLERAWWLYIVLEAVPGVDVMTQMSGLSDSDYLALSRVHCRVINTIRSHPSCVLCHSIML